MAKGFRGGSPMGGNMANMMKQAQKMQQQMLQMQQELEETKQKLEDRRLMEKEAGSIAEAALRINKVFEAAQQAADQYLENIRQHADRRENESIQHEEA